MSYDLPSFRRFCRKLRLEDGKPLVLERFQGEILRDHFGDAVELVVVIPKKNYKTTTMAALGIFHLKEIDQADVPVLAASRKQAGIMFRQAEKLIRNSGQTVKGTGSRGRDRRDVYLIDGIEYEVRAGIKEIRANGGLFYVVANDEATLDGVIPTLGLIDELHRHRTAENYGLISDGLGPRKGRMVTISTAGASEESPLGKLRANAHKYPDRAVAGRHVRYAEGATVLHEWALDSEQDDPERLRDVKKANPAKTQTLAELRRRRADPTMTTGRWLRFACGIWTVGDEPELMPTDWDVLRADIGGVVDGDEVVLAPSVGHSAVIGIASIRPNGKVAVRAEHLEAGGSILARTEDAIVELCDRYDVVKVLDPGYGMQRSMQLVEARGVPVEGAPYSTPRQIAATGTFDRFMRAGDLIHDGDPKTRAHVLAAIKKTGTMGEHYLASDETRAIVAIAQAVHSVTAWTPTPMIVLPSGGIG